MMYPGFLAGVQKIWEEDSASQEHYIGTLGDVTRKLPLAIFKRYGAFFVPNNEYVARFFGPDCRAPHYEIYDVHGECSLCNCIIFPCHLISGSVVGWVSYNPFRRLEAAETNWETQTGHYYSYPTKEIFNLSSYIFMLPAVYEKALTDGYLILTDGVFDSISFVHYGLNAAALLGSSFNLNRAFYLKFIPKIYLAMDNEEAAFKLLRNMRNLLPNVRTIKQGFTKDADDILKTSNRDKYLSLIKEGIMYHRDVYLN